jgi:hypothetical protein
MKHFLTILLLTILSGCTNSQQAAQGITEILVIAYQPGSQAGNAVAASKDQAERQVWNSAGDSRVGRAIASQAAPAVRTSIGNSSRDILILISNGIINTENLDHHGHY